MSCQATSAGDTDSVCAHNVDQTNAKQQEIIAKLTEFAEKIIKQVKDYSEFGDAFLLFGITLVWVEFALLLCGLQGPIDMLITHSSRQQANRNSVLMLVCNRYTVVCNFGSTRL